MDSKGNFPSSISSMKSESRCCHRLQDEVASAVYIPPLGSHLVRNLRQWSGDRFIPNRSAMDMDIARSLLTQPQRKENNAASSPRKQAYLKILTETLFPNGSRILAFNSNPRSTSEPSIISDVLSGNFPSHKTKSSKKPERCVPESAFRILDAPGMASEYSLNLLDWGSSDVLSIALGNTVHLWYALKKSTSELVTFDEDDGPITSVSWAPDGRHLAIGLDSSEVQLWDCSNGRMLRSLKGLHQSRVGSLSWNNNILTTGDMDGLIANNDVRIRSHVVQTYQGHEDEVCGLKWSRSGKLLASGGIDNLVHIWDITMSSLTPPPTQHQWLHRLEDHTSAVKALAWCPFQTNLLASGGGVRDRCIKFWNGNTGACLNSVDTGSQVCALLWNKNERELLSSHGFTKNQLALWKYPSMVKVQELMGHTSAALFMAQSPDGCTVASAAGDETLRFWNVFGTSKVKKPAPSVGPVTYRSHIR